MAYKRSQIAQHFGKDAETIRRWSIEFAPYLSSAANSEGRNKSLYSDEDIATLTLISEMYQTGNNTESIHLALKSGQKGEFNGILQNLRVSLTTTQTTQLREIVDRVNQLEEENTQLRAENKSIPTLQTEIRELYKEIGKLQYQIELLTKKD
jgi:DNA-binding transcriptional MerR regulator